eukprot:jgi/Chlat1/5352/Chrsp35S05273
MDIKVSRAGGGSVSIGSDASDPHKLSTPETNIGGLGGFFPGQSLPSYLPSFSWGKSMLSTISDKASTISLKGIPSAIPLKRSMNTSTTIPEQDPDRHTYRKSSSGTMKCSFCYDYNMGVTEGKCAVCGNRNPIFATWSSEDDD